MSQQGGSRWRRPVSALESPRVLVCDDTDSVRSLIVMNRSPDQFSPEDIAFLQAMAQIIDHFPCTRVTVCGLFLHRALNHQIQQV